MKKSLFDRFSISANIPLTFPPNELEFIWYANFYNWDSLQVTLLVGWSIGRLVGAAVGRSVGMQSAFMNDFRAFEVYSTQIIVNWHLLTNK